MSLFHPLFQSFILSVHTSFYPLYPDSFVYSFERNMFYACEYLKKVIENVYFINQPLLYFIPQHRILFKNLVLKLFFVFCSVCFCGPKTKNKKNYPQYFSCIKILFFLLLHAQPKNTISKCAAKRHFYFCFLFPWIKVILHAPKKNNQKAGTEVVKWKYHKSHLRTFF